MIAKWSSVVASGRPWSSMVVQSASVVVQGRPKCVSGRHRSSVVFTVFRHKSFSLNHLITDYTDYTGRNLLFTIDDWLLGRKRQQPPVLLPVLSPQFWRYSVIISWHQCASVSIRSTSESSQRASEGSQKYARSSENWAKTAFWRWFRRFRWFEKAEKVFQGIRAQSGRAAWFPPAIGRRASY